MKPDKVLESFHTVMSYELDSFGHVNNAVFLNYLEKARCDYLTIKGLSFNDFSKWKRNPVVVRANLEFKNPVIAHDELVINGWISDHTAATFSMTYKIINQKNNKLILKASTFHVFVDENNKPSRIPEEFMQKFIK